MAAEGAPLAGAATSFISAPLNCGQAPSSGGTPATGASGGLPTGCQPGCQPAAGFHPAPHDSARSYFSVRTKATTSAACFSVMATGFILPCPLSMTACSCASVLACTSLDASAGSVT